MQIRTVGELKAFMENSQMSPEKLAKMIKTSNMTVRRILKRDDQSPIPERYEPHFVYLDKVLSEAPECKKF